MLSHSGKLVVGVYLNRQVAFRIDKLYQQREFAFVALVEAFTHYVVAIFVDELIEVESFELAAVDHRLVSGHRRQLPALADIGALRFNTFETCYTVAAPN